MISTNQYLNNGFWPGGETEALKENTQEYEAEDDGHDREN